MDDRIYGVGTSPGADPDGPPVIDWSKVPLPPLPEGDDEVTGDGGRGTGNGGPVGRSVAMPGFDPGPVLTVKEAATRLDLPPRTVYDLIYYGKLVPVPQGRRVYVTLESVDAEAAYRLRKAERRSRRIRGGWSAPGEIEETVGPTESDVLITAKEAGAILGISRVTVGQLGKRGKLPREWINAYTWGYRRDAVIALAERREHKRWAMARPDVRAWGPRDRPIDRTDLITLAEAAAILGNSRAAATKLVRRGVLPGYQEHPYKHGSPILVPHYNVICLSNRSSYLKRRAESAQERPLQERVTEGWEEYNLEPVPYRGWTRSSDRNHGDQYNTRQAAAVLGVSPASLRGLVKRGRLHPIRRPYCIPRPGRVHTVRHGGNRWLFFDKQEVHALLNDTQYRKKRAADRLGKDPQRKAERQAAEIARFYELNPPHEPEHAWLYDRASFLAGMREGDAHH